MAKAVLSLAILGFCEERDRPLVERIESAPRLKLRAIQSSRFDMARQAAKQYHAIPSGGFCRLLDATELDGLILCSEECFGFSNWDPFATCLKPVLLQKNTLTNLSRLYNLYEAQQDLAPSSQFFPELPHRWTPATLRLRELLATQLGALESLTISCSDAVEDHFPLVCSLDWCLALLRDGPVSIVPVPESNAVSFLVEGRRPVRVNVNLFSPTGERNAESFATVRCAGGTAFVQDAENLIWETADSTQTETLTDERPASAVCLDLFGRRIAGGIVPIPDLTDIIRAHHLAQHLRRALTENRSLHCSGRLLTIDHTEL